MERPHRVEGVREVPRPGRERLPRLLVGGVAVAEGDDAAGARGLVQHSTGPGQLRRHRKEPQLAFRRIDEPAQQARVRRPQPAFGEGAATEWADERPFQMGAQEAGAVSDWPSRLGDCVQGGFAPVRRGSDNGGQERRHARRHRPAGVGADLLGIPAGEGEAAAPVHMDIDEPRCKRRAGGQRRHRGSRGRAQAGPDLDYSPVLDDNGATLDLFVGREDEGAGECCEHARGGCRSAGL